MVILYAFILLIQRRRDRWTR